MQNKQLSKSKQHEGGNAAYGNNSKNVKIIYLPFDKYTENEIET